MRLVELLFSVTLFADGQGLAAEQLDLTQCLAEARANNPDLRAGSSEVEKAHYQIDEARSAFRPQVSAKAEATHANVSAPAISGEQYSYGISVSQSLFAGFRDEATLQQREDVSVATQARQEQVAAQVAYETRTTFVEQLYAQQLIEVQRTAAARRRENVRLVILRFNGGRENKGAVLKSEATSGLANVEENQAVRQLEVARGKLARALGRRSLGDALVKGDLNPSAVAVPTDLAAIIAETPAHREAQASLSAAKAAVKAAYAANYPDLSAFASATRSGKWPPEDTRFAVGLSVTVPLYSGGAQTARVRTVTAESAKVEANVQSSDLSAQSDLLVALTEVQNAKERANAQADILGAAKLQAEIARNQYNLGLITFQEWDLIESGLIDAERTLLLSRRNAALANAAWNKAQGRGFDEKR